MKKYLILLFTFLCGFFLYNPNSSFSTAGYSFNDSELNNFESGFLFVDIFINNLLLCFFISFFGYISGGVITIIVIFWNGYLLAMFLKTGYIIMPLNEFLYLSKHIPFEMLSIFMFASFGLNGFYFFKELLYNKKLLLIDKSEIRKLIIPLTILFISSIIETL